jgi:branched-chain amino acid aminotransferase
MEELSTEYKSLQESADSIEVDRVAKSRIGEVDLDNPGFGTAFSDHMAVMYHREGEWQNSRIVAFGSFMCPPSLISLHYGQSVFEGMKAFRNNRGEITIFRPSTHIDRLNRSCKRLCIPEVDPDYLLAILKRLLILDSRWVPSKRGNALYIRPLIFGSDEYLGVRPALHYTGLIMTSPVGAYYKRGLKPVRLSTDRRFIRSAIGGAGDVKTAGNYSVTLLPAREAQERGFDQILWLDANEQKYVEEVGTMNIFFKFKDRLVTPPAIGTILPGITRDSVKQLAGLWGVPVEERPVSIDEVFEAYDSGVLQEIFGSGTAAVISPVGKIVHEDRTLTLDEEQAGPFTQRLYDEITGIQYGEREDVFGWNEYVCGTNGSIEG